MNKCRTWLKFCAELVDDDFSPGDRRRSAPNEMFWLESQNVHLVVYQQSVSFFFNCSANGMSGNLFKVDVPVKATDRPVDSRLVPRDFPSVSEIQEKTKQLALEHLKDLPNMLPIVGDFPYWEANNRFYEAWAHLPCYSRVDSTSKRARFSDLLELESYKHHNYPKIAKAGGNDFIGYPDVEAAFPDIDESLNAVMTSLMINYHDCVLRILDIVDSKRIARFI
jgi:hypothetical protein